MKTKARLCTLVLVLKTVCITEAFGEATGAGPAPDPVRSDVVVLGDGTKLTLLGVTYGKRHVAPNFESIGGVVQRGN